MLALRDLSKRLISEHDLSGKFMGDLTSNNGDFKNLTKHGRLEEVLTGKRGFTEFQGWI